VWDTKRQTIWLTTALVIATLVVYQDAHDESGRFDLGYFALLEAVFLAVIVVMFYVYSRKKR
jgi:preprotein translocase subunit SecG